MKKKEAAKSGLHPRNPHRFRYDFDVLCKKYSLLKEFVFVNKYETKTIDFAHPKAVKALNTALLFQYYGIDFWDIPENYLCPPIPSRADYIHHIADLLALSSKKGNVPTGKHIQILDIGVGANCIYPIIGRKAYDWAFVGTDIDKKAIESAQKIVNANPILKGSLGLRLQKTPNSVFKGIIKEGDTFACTICNPPFYASPQAAQKQSQRKWKNLGKDKTNPRNFGGQSKELWCAGGEKAFIQKMIEESRQFTQNCLWFTSLVSNKDHIPFLQKILEKQKAKQVKIIAMAQGQKTSRILAWQF